MKIYKLECTNQYGQNEIHGYYLKIENAEKDKSKLDEYNENKKYGIKQHIIEIETQD